MHPIERLRFVARAEGVPGEVLAIEATAALMTFAEDPAALVAASRRVLARQVSCGPLWWACARLLTAGRVRDAGAETIALLEGDTTQVALSWALDPDPDDDPSAERVVEARAVGDGGAIVDASGLADLEVGRDDRRSTWLVTGVGTHLSDPMWSSVLEHWSASPRRDEELVPLEWFTHFVGPDGPLPMVALGEADCPVAPELFRLAG